MAPLLTKCTLIGWCARSWAFALVVWLHIEHDHLGAVGRMLGVGQLCYLERGEGNLVGV